MTPGNYGQPTPTPGTWPPPPTAQPGIWPPPATATLTVPFKFLQRRISGKEYNKARYSDFRDGSLQISEAGLMVSGKAVIRSEIRYPIFIVALLIARFIGIIVYAIMEYAFRRDAVDQVPWAAVRRIQLAPQKLQACIVYDAPNYKGVIKTFSLAFTLDPTSFPAFAQTVPQWVSGRVTEGPLGGVITPRVWIRLGLLLLIVIFAIIAAVTKQH